jgi:hypothetical protein
MAGGKLAEHVTCMVCLGDDALITKATRIYEGSEDDRYRCEQGHEFGMDWSKGPATEPQWPLDPELAAALAKSRG